MIILERADKFSRKVLGKNGNIIEFINGVAEVSQEDADFLTRVEGAYIVKDEAYIKQQAEKAAEVKKKQEEALAKAKQAKEEKEKSEAAEVVEEATEEVVEETNPEVADVNVADALSAALDADDEEVDDKELSEEELIQKELNEVSAKPKAKSKAKGKKK